MPIEVKGVEPTGFHILRHRRCGEVTRAYLGTRFHAGWYQASPNDAGRWVDIEDHRTPCAGCGMALRSAAFRQIYGRYASGFGCNARCTGSTGHVCECSCGGSNHGGKWGGAP